MRPFDAINHTRMEGIAPATGTALLLLVAFVLPGFATLVTRESTYAIKEASTPFERLLLWLLSYSVRIYGILLLAAWLLGWNNHDISILYHGKQPLRDYVVLAFLGLFAFPVVLSECGRFWRRSKKIRPWLLRRLAINTAHSTPSGWEHFFSSNTTALVRATLDDGRVVAGYFGDRSFAAYTADTQDFFLEEERWELDADAWFVRPAPLSFGIWVPHEHIVSLEVYSPPGDQPPSRLEKATVAALTAATVVRSHFVLSLRLRRRLSASR